MTRLLERTQVQQEQLQQDQRRAEERTAQLIERLGEQRLYNWDQPRRPRVEGLKEGEDIEKFLLTFERQMMRAGIGEDEWVTILAESLSGLAPPATSPALSACHHLLMNRLVKKLTTKNEGIATLQILAASEPVLQKFAKR